MKKEKTSTLKKKLDRIFSEYIRRSNAIDGYTSCISCGKTEYWKDQDAGHYESRVYLALRYDERNVQPQCRYCNRFREGEKNQFGFALERKYGEGIREELARKKHRVVKDFPYHDLIEEYQQKLLDLDD